MKTSGRGHLAAVGSLAGNQNNNYLSCAITANCYIDTILKSKHNFKIKTLNSGNNFFKM